MYRATFKSTQDDATPAWWHVVQEAADPVIQQETTANQDGCKLQCISAQQHLQTLLSNHAGKQKRETRMCC
jgi:hypothetical protein